MRNFFNKGIIALENNDVPTDDAPVIEDAANSAETDLLEVTEEAAEGATTDAAVDEAVEAVSSLESFVVALESANATGGLDRAGAAVMNIGLEHIYSRLGYQKESAAVVSLENFGQQSSRAGATQIALEGVKEKIKEIWAAIVAHIKKAIEWVKGHFNKIFGTAEKLQKRAKALSEAAKGINGQPKEKTFENERIVKALNIGGNIPSSVSAELAKVTKVAEETFTQLADFNGKGAETLLEQMGNTNGKVAGIAAVPFTGGFTKVNNPQGAGFSVPGSGLSLYRSPAMLGNKAIVAEAPDTALQGDAAVTALSKTSMAVGAFDPKAKEATKTAVSVVDPGEVGKIADEVATLCQEVIKYKAKTGKFSDLKAKIVAAAERAGKDANSEEDKDKAAFHAAMQKIATNSVNNLDRCPAAMSVYVLNTGKAALDLAEQSLKQYTAKK